MKMIASIKKSDKQLHFCFYECTNKLLNQSHVHFYLQELRIRKSTFSLVCFFNVFGRAEMKRVI